MAKKTIPKYEHEELIQYVGVKDLSDEEKGAIKGLASEYFEKIKRAVQNISTLVVHIKSYASGGKRKKYSTHIRALSPQGIIESCKSYDWDLPRVLHKSFTNILTQAESLFSKYESKNSWKKKNRQKR